ncbi:MAG: FkbM family methyltransferase [Pseudomonadota bacterium]
MADLIYDVGMHNGDDTAYYLAKGFRVLAFEAHPDLAKAGRARFAHALDQGQLEIVEGAIVPVDHAGDDVTFFANATRSEWGTISADLAHSSDRRADGTTTITVPACRS